MSAFRKFIRERSRSFLVAIVKQLSSLKENNNADASKTTVKLAGVTEFDLSGMKVIVKLKSNVELKGRISFFYRLNCRDCTVVQKFFHEKGLKLMSTCTLKERRSSWRGLGAHLYRKYFQREAIWGHGGIELFEEQRWI